MAKADSRTQIRPDLIKTSLHHLVVIKKGMTVKRVTERWKDDRGFALLKKIWGKYRVKKEKRDRWKIILEQDKS